MGSILGRQSYDCGRSRILVYGSLVQELLNDSIDANMIIIESKINFFHHFSRKVFTSFKCGSYLNSLFTTVYVLSNYRTHNLLFHTLKI